VFLGRDCPIAQRPPLSAISPEKVRPRRKPSFATRANVHPRTPAVSARGALAVHVSLDAPRVVVIVTLILQYRR